MAQPLAVLFDIDETLVHTGGSGARSWAWAFEQLHGVAADIGDHSSAGETDPQVGRATFKDVLGRDPSHEEMGRLYSKYLWHLAEDIWTADGYRVLDGATDLLGRLSDAGVILGVISGAMEGAARMKMEPGNLNRYFVFGAYGSDSPDRTEVTRLAIAKASRLHGRALAPPGGVRRRRHTARRRFRPRGRRHRRRGCHGALRRRGPGGSRGRPRAAIPHRTIPGILISPPIIRSK